MIGWASAPFDPQWERGRPRRAALMALAGPAANYTLMLLAVVGLRVGQSMGWLYPNPATRHPNLAGPAPLRVLSPDLLPGHFPLFSLPPPQGPRGDILLFDDNPAPPDRAK